MMGSMEKRREKFEGKWVKKKKKKKKRSEKENSRRWSYSVSINTLQCRNLPKSITTEAVIRLRRLFDFLRENL